MTQDIEGYVIRGGASQTILFAIGDLGPSMGPGGPYGGAFGGPYPVCSYKDSEFEQVLLIGDLGSNSPLSYVSCAFGLYEMGIALTNLNGFLENCLLIGNVITSPAAVVTSTGLKSALPVGLSPSISVTKPTAAQFLADPNAFTSVNLHNTSGHIQIKGMDHANCNVYAAFIAGSMVIDSSCTAGDLKVEGLVTTALIDNSAGTTVDCEGNIASGKTVLEILEEQKYDRTVCIDTGSPYTGTEYPIGTRAFPVNNLADAIVICETHNIFKIDLYSDLTIDQNIPSGYTIQGHKKVETITLTGTATPYLHLEDAYVQGDAGGGNGLNIIRIDNCVVKTLTNFEGGMWFCTITEDIEIADGVDVLLRNCVAGSYEVYDSNPVKPSLLVGQPSDGETISVNVFSLSGPITIKNVDNANKKVHVYGDDISLVVDPSCTAGEIDVHGVARVDITDNSNGANVTVDNTLQSIKALVTTLL